MGQENLRKWYRRFLIGFFVMMLSFTILSRIVDSLTIPKVTPGRAKTGSIEKTIQGTGRIEGRQFAFVDVREGLKIGEIKAAKGKLVETGEALFAYQTSSITEKRQELSRELEKLKLELLEEEVSSETYPNVTEEDLAVEELKAADRELELGRQKLEKAQEAYRENIQRLEENYRLRMSLTDQELEEETRESYRQSKKDYEAAKMDREEAVRSARREVDRLEKKVERLEEEGADEGELEEAREELSQKEEDLDAAAERWDLAVDKAEAKMQEAQDRYDQSDSEDSTAKLTLKEAYESSLKQEADTLKEQEEKAAALEWARERAEKSLGMARKKDEHARLSDQQQKRLSSLRRRSKQIDIDLLESQIQEIDDLLKVNGEVYAPQSGFVARMDLEPGRATTGDEAVQLAVGQMQMLGEYEKEKGVGVDPGDKVTLRLGNSNRPYEATVESVNLLGDGGGGSGEGDKGGQKAEFIVPLEAQDVILGDTVSYQCRKNSGTYYTVIPLSALHEDVRGHYCLKIQEKKGILGTEFQAVRVDVTLLEIGDTQAAVEGALYDSDRIIAASDRIVLEGDRVRVISDIKEEGK